MARLRKKPHQRPPPASPSSTSADKTKMSNTDGLRVGGGSGAWSLRTQWMFFAVASGACAAFNGVFAKLTTTELTTNLSQAIAKAFGLSNIESAVEVVIRAMFFGLNLIFNGVMWSLFTTALARGTSTTQVSIMNTSTNFMITAFLGWAIFSEALPAMWWAGAALLVAGNVIIGRKDESKDGAPDGVSSEGYGSVPQSYQESEREGVIKDDEDEDIIDLGDVGERR